VITLRQKRFLDSLLDKVEEVTYVIIRRKMAYLMTSILRRKK